MIFYNLFHYADNLALVIIFCIAVLLFRLIVFCFNVIFCFLGMISFPLHILLCLSHYNNLPSFRSQITAACPHLILDVQIYYNHAILLTDFCSPSKNVVLLVFFHASLLTQLMLFLTLFKCLVVLFTV